MMLNQKPVTGAVQGIRRCQAPRLAAPGAALAESIEEGVDFQLPQGAKTEIFKPSTGGNMTGFPIGKTWFC